MAEPTLTAAFEELKADVGFHLGYGRTESTWNSRQAADVEICLRVGMRQFYHCGYDWSFLKPIATLPLASGNNRVNLPDDFSQADGPIQVSVEGQSSFYQPLMLGPWQVVYENEKRMPDTAGVPVCLCEVVRKKTTTLEGQRFEWRVWPKADADYLLTFAYRINPDALSGKLPYAYGGSQHSQTLLLSCKAAAERDIDNIPANSPMAVHQPAFAAALEQSKLMDKRTKPHTVGIMVDRSDWRRQRVPGSVPRPLLPIIVQGTIWD